VLADRVARAASARDRLVGLLDRTRLEPGEGLWLNPCGSVHTWGLRFPIDVLFLDAGGRVLALRSPLPPWRVALAPRGTHSVLEVAAGAARSVRVGERLTLTPGAT